MDRKRIISDPFRLSPRLEAKWRCSRNVIIFHAKMILIMNKIVLYGTSETRLNIEKGIKNIRDFMVADSKPNSSLDQLAANQD